MKIFCVFDSKSESYGTPMFIETKGLAVRAFTQVVNDPQSQISMYPEDFTMFELGSFDPKTGKFVLHSTPSSVGVAVEFKKVDTRQLDMVASA